eukprot:CAMPEP_0197626862 /NCGR_PEP_ID=MMETSP1338-20131121/5644_1 /TAXON_ID=43686 ORGANISM="Pelagodinium beii, Strain RCC1491" /NCGR_SAMPLE_ID=MMETSP1338 /ASSEMBLY_ACC=CAM_ASM_000754 /LENGTH=211 /DNA_ID=CAMNT_0043197439 /DNA_START=56 /DNA_END=688 /DNA_ORIENTATION=+
MDAFAVGMQSPVAAPPAAGTSYALRGAAAPATPEVGYSTSSLGVAALSAAAASMLHADRRRKVDKVQRAAAPKVVATDRKVSEKEVRQAQAAWASSIKKISKTYLDGGDYVAEAAAAAGELYGYGRSNVLFKPTKAKESQFRPMASQAMSYFVGSDAVTDGIKEDAGFAINGGKGWSDVVFDNHQIEVVGDAAIAMGNYYFTSAEDGSKTK